MPDRTIDSLPENTDPNPSDWLMIANPSLNNALQKITLDKISAGNSAEIEIGTDYIKIDSFLCCWGIADEDAWNYFPVPFLVMPALVGTAQSSKARMFVIRDWSQNSAGFYNGFYPKVYRDDGGSSGNSGGFIAIGKWE